MSKTYKQKTKNFGIPVLGWEDRIWPELEMMKWQMVENMLMASMKGAVNSIFREGHMRLSKSGWTYSVVLSGTGNEPSLQGSVGGAYFDAPSSLVWDNLSEGRTYFLYIEGSTKTFQDESAVKTVSSTTRLENQYVTLVAKVDLTDYTIDRYPIGKVNTRDLSQHVLDNDCPHGEKLIQDEIWIRKRLVLGGGKDAELELESDGVVYNVPVSEILKSFRKKSICVDFESGGTEGVEIVGEGNVLFANVIRVGSGGGYMGEISFDFYKEGDDVKNKSKVRVYNTGEKGIQLRAMLNCELGGDLWV